MVIENYIKKIDSKGQFILDDKGEFIMELQSSEIIEEPILTDLEKKQKQYQELLPTDWYFVRKFEKGVEVPGEILIERQAIREKYK